MDFALVGERGARGARRISKKSRLAPRGLFGRVVAQHFGRQHGRQLAVLEHLAQNVGAADEFAFDEQLRNGRPVGEIFDALTRFGIDQNIDRDDFFDLNAAAFEDFDREGGKAALRKLRRAFHIENDRVVRDLLENFAFRVHYRIITRAIYYNSGL